MEEDSLKGLFLPGGIAVCHYHRSEWCDYQVFRSTSTTRILIRAFVVSAHQIQNRAIA